VRKTCARAAADGGHPRTAQHALQRQVARIARRRMQVQRVFGPLHRHLGCGNPGLRCFVHIQKSITPEDVIQGFKKLFLIHL
jgi:hypothetical protein